MHISLITLFVLLEVILFLLGASITLGIMLYLRKSRDKTSQQAQQETPDEQPAPASDVTRLDSSYIDYLEQAIQRNQQQLEQQSSATTEAEADSEADTDSDENQSNSDELQILQLASNFLNWKNRPRTKPTMKTASGTRLTVVCRPYCQNSKSVNCIQKQ